MQRQEGIGKSDHDLVRLTLGTADQGAGLLVADEVFLLGIPFQLAAKQHADIAQVARADGTMMGEHIGYRLRAVLHTGKQVPHMLDGRPVEVQQAKGMQTGTARGIAADGALLVESDDGTLGRVIVGDVTLRETLDARD
mgnify:CR=1 FL=1